MEVLTAYVCQNAPVTPAGKEPITPQPRKPRTDIQAVLTVLGRRPVSPKRDGHEHRLDLSFTHLEGAFLKDANLNGANFHGSNLWNSNPWKA
jgi:hypothetical protein